MSIWIIIYWACPFLVIGLRYDRNPITRKGRAIRYKSSRVRACPPKFVFQNAGGLFATIPHAKKTKLYEDAKHRVLYKKKTIIFSADHFFTGTFNSIHTGA